uniref:Uncharacterized protein n=1 Tax=Avena sativa TaxID=4498 RepID=A0ACD5Y980_AVESA
MAAGDDDQRNPWTARHYILAALGGCLAATAIIIIVSVVLSPGRIIFSVTQASHGHIDNGGVNLKLTILANNTSHRTKVQFLGFFVVLTNSTSSTGRYTTDADIVEPRFPFPSKDDYQSSEQNPVNVKASVHLAHEMVSSFTGKGLDSSGLTVLLTSEVRFKIGVARTKIFDIRVSCPGVIFVDEGDKSHAQKTFQCNG